ncbi:glycosyltransferase family 4 protein [Leptolyngbya sp. GB1-A1]|uniref:glycosyltransferase family 4 protein n=1 Tax=Leptolyngbya sp. GB1-A1 TaxID=2933908 RepID=UPI003299904A
MKKVLFISHDASRTGAPILLLNFLRWFKENTNIPFKIILGKGGPLEAEFAELAPVTVYRQYRRDRLSQTVLNRLSLYRLKQYLARDDIGLIYANTITNHHILNQLAFLQCPVISHVHELEYIIHLMAGDQFATTKSLTTHYITASNAVKDNLVSRHLIPPAHIDTVYGFVPVANLKPNIALSKRDTIRAQLHLPDNAFVVGASGTLGWRKSPDLFIQLAQSVRRKYPEAPIYFMWIGGDEGEHLRYFELRYDIQRLNLEHSIRFLGNQPNPLEYFAAFDVFALLSREDPYPLVCLEAALLEKPILCFDNSGGEKEFVEDDCGFVIPYLDIETTADKIHLLLESPELRQRFGQRAAQKVRERHDISTAASQLTQIIQRFYQ